MKTLTKELQAQMFWTTLYLCHMACNKLSLIIFRCMNMLAQISKIQHPLVIRQKHLTLPLFSVHKLLFWQIKVSNARLFSCNINKVVYVGEKWRYIKKGNYWVQTSQAMSRSFRLGCNVKLHWDNRELMRLCFFASANKYIFKKYV